MLWNKNRQPASGRRVELMPKINRSKNFFLMSVWNTVTERSLCPVLNLVPVAWSGLRWGPAEVRCCNTFERTTMCLSCHKQPQGPGNSVSDGSLGCWFFHDDALQILSFPQLLFDSECSLSHINIITKHFLMVIVYIQATKITFCGFK